MAGCVHVRCFSIDQVIAPIDNSAYQWVLNLLGWIRPFELLLLRLPALAALAITVCPSLGIVLLLGHRSAIEQTWSIGEMSRYDAHPGCPLWRRVGQTGCIQRSSGLLGIRARPSKRAVGHADPCNTFILE